MRRRLHLALVRLATALACIVATIGGSVAMPTAALADPYGDYAQMGRELPATGDAVVPIAIGIIVVAVVIGIVIYNKRS